MIALLKQSHYESSKMNCEFTYFNFHESGFEKRNWVSFTNSDFPIPIYLHFNVGDLKYFKLSIILDQNFKYQRFTPSGCNDIAFSSQNLWQKLSFFEGWCRVANISFPLLFKSSQNAFSTKPELHISTVITSSLMFTCR